MKKVLVTGAAGAVGIHVIKYLLAEGKYEITVLDLKNKTTFQRFKRFKRRVNILYGDVTDRVLLEALVKDHDYIINLASALPPLSDMKKGLAEAIDYDGCENIVRAISYYNPKCHLFYASTTSMYKDLKNPSVKSKINLGEYDYFSKAKLDTENLIKSKLKNYTIYRLPIVLSNPLSEAFMYHGRRNDLVDVITKEDAAYAFVKGLRYATKLNKKTFNLAMEESVKYGELLDKLLEITGFNFKYIVNRLFVEKNYYSPVCSDRDELEEIINYRNDSLAEYYNRMKSRAKNRKVRKFLAKTYLKKFKKKGD